MDKYSFSCERSCYNKCCNAAIQLTIDEVKLFFDKVPIMACFYAIKIHDGIDEALRNKIIESALPVFQGETDEIDYAIIMELTTAPKGISIPCPMLFNDVCVAHNFGKPERCTMFPLNPYVAHSIVGRSLEMISDRCLGIKKSSDDKNEATIWDSEKTNNFDHFFDQMKKQKKLAKMIIDIHDTASGDDAVAKIIEVAGAGGGFIYLNIPPVDGIFKEFDLNKSEYINSQIPILTKLLGGLKGRFGEEIVQNQIDLYGKL
jgi:hypothetical protein